MAKERRGETHISAKQCQAEAGSRIPQADENPSWASHPPSAQEKGPQTVGGHHRKKVAVKRHGFPKSCRLRKRREYLTVQRGGRRYYSKLFIVFTRPGCRPWTRIGITVTRKVGKAVVRNRVKRLVREVFRQHKEHFPAGCDLVVVAKTEAARAGYQEMLDDLLGLCRRLRHG